MGLRAAVRGRPPCAGLSIQFCAWCSSAQKPGRHTSIAHPHTPVSEEPPRFTDEEWGTRGPRRIPEQQISTAAHRPSCSSVRGLQGPAGASGGHEALGPPRLSCTDLSTPSARQLPGPLRVLVQDVTRGRSRCPGGGAGGVWTWKQCPCSGRRSVRLSQTLAPPCLPVLPEPPA